MTAEAAPVAVRGAQRPRIEHVPPAHSIAQGEDAVELAASAGLLLDDWQAWALARSLGTREDGQWQNFEVGVLVPRQNGKNSLIEARELAGLYLLDESLLIHTAHEFKMLDVNTPILTANRGWSTMGELTDDDLVFAPDGQPTRLTVHPVATGRPCWLVKFADGQFLIADGDHLWSVTEADRNNGGSKRRIVTTDEIREKGLVHHWPRENSRDRNMYRWRVDLPKPLQLPDAEMPIDPWLLGFWLGDGDSDGGRLTVGERDLPHVVSQLERIGGAYSLGEDRRKGGRVRYVGIRGLKVRLREAGVLGCKRIPDVYLRGSEQQRRALLAGIMDSDGTSAGHQMAVTTVKFDLMNDVLCLVRSLGYRATLREFRASLNGADAGPMWRVQFSAAGTNPFWLERKNTWIRHLKLTRSKYIAITSIEPVPTRPMRCITVEHPSGCYLAGRGFMVTHNTSQEHFLRVQTLIQGSSDLSRRVRRVSTSHGDEGIELHGLPSLIAGSSSKMVRRAPAPPRLRFLARSRTSARGFSADLLVYDEAMVLSADTVGSSMPTMTAMPNPQLWYAASEGRDDAWHLARVRRRGIAGTSPRLMYVEWSAELCHEMCTQPCKVHDHPADPATWARANPALGIRIREEFLAAAQDSMDPATFAASHLAVSEWPADENGWLVISEPAWDACADAATDRPAPRGIALAADATEDGQYAAIAVAGRRGDRRMVAEIPEGDHRPGTSWVPERLAELAARYRPCAIVIDPRGPAGHLIDACEKLKLEIVKPSQTEMAQAYGLFIVSVRDRDIVHLGTAQPDLRAAVAGAASRDLGDGMHAWARKGTAADISPLIAVTLASWAHGKYGRKPYDLLKSIG